MKKSLLALAVLGAFAGVAQAQTSVTIYGSFDAGVRNLTNANTAGDSRLTMGSSGTFNSNRIGFRGIEDLGGGMNAHFTLESGFNSGTGALGGNLFGRSAFVGLGGKWGSLDFGRQYSVSFKTIGAYDPFTYKYPTISPTAFAAAGDGLSGLGLAPAPATGVPIGAGIGRFSNDIQYTGTFGPITARAEYALGEVAGSRSNGASQAIGLSYAGGPFSVGAAYTKKKPNIGGATFVDNDQWTVGAAFATGPFRVAAGFIDERQETGTAVAESKTQNAWLGGSYNLTPAMALTAGYYRTDVDTATTSGRRNLILVGGTYGLSKRTNLYAAVDNARFSGTGSLRTPVAGSGILAAPVGQDRQTGISVGVNHLF